MWFWYSLYFIVFFSTWSWLKRKDIWLIIIWEESGSLSPRYVTYIINFHQNVFKIHHKEPMVLLSFLGIAHSKGCVFWFVKCLLLKRSCISTEVIPSTGPEWKRKPHPMHYVVIQQEEISQFLCPKIPSIKRERKKWFHLNYV